ncbi:MAG: 16S rRNA (guanine(527)-N(7))-methyltransferase RsmG [Sphingomicrobium sp.]
MIDQLAAVSGRDVSRETVEKLDRYEQMVRDEAAHHNLVSKLSLDDFWSRHVLDSAQLLRFGAPGSTWADIGSGAGLPGIVIACLSGDPVHLIEPRRLRADFLQRVVDDLGLNATVHRGKAESARGRFDVITARAVAPLARLLEISHHLSTGKTLFLFPKGKSAKSELAAARQTWQASLHVERSVVDVDSDIILARNVRRKTR